MSAKQRNEAAHQSKHKHTRKPSRLPLILAVGGIAVLVIALLTLKDQSQTTMSSAVSSTAADPSAIPEEQLNTALAENHPTLGFYHSNNCKKLHHHDGNDCRSLP